jgi:hypothetical protein
MDWVEKLFGFSPDNGDGSFEAAIVAVCGFLVLAVILSTPRARAYVRGVIGKYTART